MERYYEVPLLKHLPFITMQTHVLLSLGGTKRLKSTKLISHLGDWKPGCPIYPEVAASTGLWPLTPFALRLANLPVQGLKKIWEGKQRGLILRVMQLDSWCLVREKELLFPHGHKKL